MINYEIKIDDVLTETGSCDIERFQNMLGRLAIKAHSIRKSVNSITFYLENKFKPIGKLAYEEEIYEITWESEEA